MSAGPGGGCAAEREAHRRAIMLALALDVLEQEIEALLTEPTE